MEPIYLISYGLLLLAIGIALYSAGIEEQNRERLEQLADRLRQLYKRAGQPALRVRRPRRLHFEMHRALRELEMSLRSCLKTPCEPSQGSFNYLCVERFS